MRRMALLALWTASTLLGACASVPPPAVPTQLFQDQAFDAPAQRIDASEVFALSPAMKRYLEVEIAPQLRQMGAQRGLVEALYSKAQLRLDYETELTRTAAQAFDARSGNCLSLVVMTAALAKHLSLPVEYQAVVGNETWSRQGGLNLINGHVNITVGRRLVDRINGVDSAPLLELNFGNVRAGRGSVLQQVSEATLLAMFMNNRAAEAMARDGLGQAYAYAREAVIQDPAHAGAYNTLAVIYQRRGLPDAAERALRHALAQDPRHRAAMHNLARLLDAQGRSAEAAPWQAKLAQLEAEPPLHHFDLGVAAVQAGDFKAGLAHLRREMRRDPDYHEFHFWLALALYGLGDAAQAREHLSTAMKNSTTRREQSIYAAKLQRLPVSGGSRAP
jgi:Flp pilus assembly protein TadD